MTKKKIKVRRQPLVRWQDKVQDTRQFRPADLEAARTDPPVCPVCSEPGKIDLHSGYPLFAHTATHEAETPMREEMRSVLGRWLHRALPDSQVRLLLPWQDTYLDVGAVRADGARLAIRIISEEPDRDELRSMRDSLLEEQTALLFLLDPLRLPRRAWGEGARVFSAQFRRAESDLLRMDDPLLYLLPHRRQLLLLEPPSVVLPLLREKRNLGQCQGEAHHYRISELRLREGRWWLDRRFDEKPQQPPEPPPALLRRLEDL